MDIELINERFPEKDTGNLPGVPGNQNSDFCFPLRRKKEMPPNPPMMAI